jgi:Fe2+ or Zn2+ uptake regulation protein
VDGISSAHDHAVCVECGTIFDIDRGVVRLPPPPATLPGGLEVTSVRVEYDVICASCRSGVQGATAAPSAAAPSHSKKTKGGQNG